MTEGHAVTAEQLRALRERMDKLELAMSAVLDRLEPMAEKLGSLCDQLLAMAERQAAGLPLH